MKINKYIKKFIKYPILFVILYVFRYFSTSYLTNYSAMAELNRLQGNSSWMTTEFCNDLLSIINNTFYLVLTIFVCLLIYDIIKIIEENKK